MATTTNTIKTYDIESVFSAYINSLNADKDEEIAFITKEIEDLTALLNTKTEALKELKGSLRGKKDVKLDSRESTDLSIKIDRLTEKLKGLTRLSDTDRAELVTKLTEAKKEVASKAKTWNAIISKDPTTLSAEEISQMTSLPAELATLSSDIKAMQEKLTTDDELIELEELKKKRDLAKDSESAKFTAESTDVDTKYTEEFKAAQALATEIKKLNEEIAAKKEELNKVKTETPTLETFTAFLEANNLSTVHAEELFKYHDKPEKFAEITYKEFRTRKMHPTRDILLKKVGAPSAITIASGIATLTIIGASGLIGGSVVAGIIPVSGTPGVTETAVATTAILTASASTPIIIGGKGLLTKAYYRVKSQTANENVEKYKSGTKLENLNISKLIAQIQKTSHEIHESTGVKKHTLNIINRNRIHRVEVVTKELFDMYFEISRADIDPQLKAKELKPIYDILSSIQDFILNDIAEARAHAMLTCKSTKKDTHTYMIENIDIYASLKIYLDRMAEIDPDLNNRAAQLKDAKKTVKNIDEKTTVAHSLLGGKKKLITELLDFDKKYGKYVMPAAVGSAVVETMLVDDKKNISLTLDNGKTVIVAVSDIDPTKTIAAVKLGTTKTTITYTDGANTTIAKPAKVAPEFPNARRNLYEALSKKEFVQELKDAGFSTRTIKTLKEKLEEWLADNTIRWSVKGNVKNLYEFAFDKIKAEKESADTDEATV